MVEAANILLTILKSHPLSLKEVEELSRRVKASAVHCGNSRLNQPLSSDDWNLVDDISDQLWYGAYDLDDKILVGFQLFELLPSYWHTLTPYYDHVREKALSSEQKETVWRKFVQYLADEAHYADPVGYVLWVDFFEDPETVRETWHGLISHNQKKESLRKLIESAGPVSFDLKESVYRAMLKDQRNHPAIFRSLLASAYDVYGQIDKGKARHFVAKLKVNKTTEDFRLLTEKLNSTA